MFNATSTSSQTPMQPQGPISKSKRNHRPFYIDVTHQKVNSSVRIYLILRIPVHHVPSLDNFLLSKAFPENLQTPSTYTNFLSACVKCFSFFLFFFQRFCQVASTFFFGQSTMNACYQNLTSSQIFPSSRVYIFFLRNFLLRGKKYNLN